MTVVPNSDNKNLTGGRTLKNRSSLDKAALTNKGANTWIEKRIHAIPARHWKATDFMLEDGKAIYAARNKKNHFIVWGTWESPYYDSVSLGMMNDGRPCFWAWRNEQKFYVCVDQDMQARETVFTSSVQPKSPPSEIPMEWEGKTLRIVERGGSDDPLYGRKYGLYFAVFGDWESQPYDRIDSARIVDGKPLFCGRCDGEWFVVWGDCIGRGHGSVSQPMILDGEPMFIDSRSREEDRHGYLHFVSTYFIVHGNREGKSYDYVRSYRIVDGRPLYAARGNGAWRIVWGDEESKPYGRIFSLEVTDQVISFGARKGQYIYHVTRKIAT